MNIRLNNIQPTCACCENVYSVYVSFAVVREPSREENERKGVILSVCLRAVSTRIKSFASSTDDDTDKRQQV